MSAIAAIVRLDGQPVDVRLLQRMTENARPFGPDDEGTWSAGPVGLGECRLHRTVFRRTRPPLVDEAGQLAIVLDGRLDNRQELLRLLRGRGLDAEAADTELVLEAYRRWGPNLVSRLAGDFAFAIWDGGAQRLVAVRDHLGIRPLHYAVNNGHVLIASRIGQLFEAQRLRRKINDGSMGDFLAGNLDHAEETFFQGVYRVPPGHLLIVDRHGVTRRRHWNLNPDRTIRYRRSSEYADHFRALLKQVVDSHLQADDQVGLMLSGGIDSASIACLVSELMRDKQACRQGFSTYTAVFEDLRMVDERERAEAVIQRLDLDSHMVPGDEMWTFKSEDARPAAWDEPFEGTFDVIVQALLDAAAARGVKVLLTGHGGDVVLWGSYYYLLDLLVTLRWETLFREFRCYTPRTAWGLALEFMVKPLLAMPRPDRQFENWIPSWVRRDFARRIGLNERLRAALPPRRARLLSRQVDYESICSVQHSVRMLWLQSEGLRRGIELRHPYFDVRLVEFLLAVPSSEKIQYGYPKAILRRALGKSLPDSVRRRICGGQFQPLLDRGLRVHERSRWKAHFAESRLAALGYIDDTTLHKCFERYLNGELELRDELARAYRAELWLRSQLDQKRPGSPLTTA